METSGSLTLRFYGAQGDHRPITLALQLSAPVTSRDRRPARRARGGLVDIRKLQKRLNLWITCTCPWTAGAALHLPTARLGYPQGSRSNDRMECTSHLGFDCSVAYMKANFKSLQQTHCRGWISPYSKPFSGFG